MSKTANDNIKFNTPKAADDRTGKFANGVWQGFATVAEANSAILPAYRPKTLTVWIGENEYVYLKGTTDNDLILKHPEKVGIILSGNNPAWRSQDGHTAKLTAPANINLAFSADSDPVYACLWFYQNGTGNWTLTVNGAAVTVNPAANSLTTIVIASYTGGIDVRSGYNPATTTEPTPGETVKPTAAALAVNNATPTKLEVTFSEACTFSVSGWSFTRDGVNQTFTGVTGSGTNKATFTLSQPIAAGEVLLANYNEATGDTLDLAGNELAAFANRAVSNNVASAAGYVTWLDLMGVYTVEQNGVTKTSGGSGYTHFIRTNEDFSINNKFYATDGDNSTGNDKIFGLTASTNPTSYADFTVGFNISMSGALYFLENGGNGSLGTYNAGDKFRFYWKGDNTIDFQKSADGVTWNTLKTTTQTLPATLKGMVAIGEVGMTFSEIRREA